MGKRIYLTDKEVASAIEVSQSTLGRIVRGWIRGGRGRKTASSRTINLNDAKPETFGGFRRWKVSSLARVLGITEDELLRRVS